ncbi:hypothetical protein Tco_0384275, partial [Tanacetum coccineum]
IIRCKIKISKSIQLIAFTNVINSVRRGVAVWRGGMIKLHALGAMASHAFFKA